MVQLSWDGAVVLGVGFAAGRFVDFGVSRYTWSQRRKEGSREMCGLATLSLPLRSSPLPFESAFLKGVHSELHSNIKKVLPLTP
jgi:hypothetical protein